LVGHLDEAAMPHVNLADAKARLSELVELAVSGERIVITRRGKPVAEMSKPDVELQPVDTKALQDLTHRLPRQKRGAGTALRRLRDQSRY
jgi:antitoxin (DNA-binding transcriptional repressor) of toxin-antitoxin stability system